MRTTIDRLTLFLAVVIALAAGACSFVGKQPPTNHFHLVPANEMTLAEYKAALKKVKLTKVEP
jgi:hypothetical protein